MLNKKLSMIDKAICLAERSHSREYQEIGNGISSAYCLGDKHCLASLLYISDNPNCLIQDYLDNFTDVKDITLKVESLINLGEGRLVSVRSGKIFLTLRATLIVEGIERMMKSND